MRPDAPLQISLVLRGLVGALWYDKNNSWPQAESWVLDPGPP